MRQILERLLGSSNPGPDRLLALPTRWRWPVVAMLGALTLAGLVLVRPVDTVNSHRGLDVTLYKSVVQDMRDGQGYYQAAAAEQRRKGFPLRPFMTVRPPVLATLLAALPGGDVGGRVALGLLGGVALLLVLRRSATQMARPLPTILAAASGVLSCFIAPAAMMHEVWAGTLILISLMLYDPRRMLPSLLTGALAVAFRELAAPYLLVMAALAWRDGLWRQAMCWATALVVFGFGLWWHAQAVAAVQLPSDPASPGWLALGGWAFVLDALQMNAITLVSPSWLAACLAPFALFGLMCWRGDLADRVRLTVLGYCMAFLFVGRHDTRYWGLLIAPLWPLGLPGAWTVLRGMLRRA